MPQFVVDVSAGGATYRQTGEPSSVDAFTTALRAAATYKSPARLIVVGSIITTLLALSIDALLGVAVIAAAIVSLVFAAAATARKRRVPVLYRLDDRAARAFESLSNGAGWLAESQSLWRLADEEPAQRPANPTRVDAHVSRGEAANVMTNVTVPSIAAAGETLLFLPDALLIRDRASNVVDVPYSFLRVECETMRVSEAETVPGDSQRVASSWLYTNKDGGPDRRRANNRQIPVLEYARVALSWRRSERVFLVSSVQAARHFANALVEMAQFRTQQPVAKAPAPKPAIPPAVKPTPEVKMPVQQATVPTDLERLLQASLDRKRRLDELQRESAVQRTQTTAPQTNAEWIAQGRSATVHGFATGDFVYVGSRLRALTGHGGEPALIDPALSVDPAYANVSGEGLTYWPSYDGISAASRRAFLQWLAGGRSDPNASIGYVFIFFYGLERRVFELLEQSGSTADEVLAIAHEVARLIDVYGDKSNSFASYANSFLDLIASIEPRARDLGRVSSRPMWGVSQRLKIALGELANAGKPVPASYALEWVRSTYSLNTPATRCTQQFELLFHIRYAKQFGDGMVVKPNKSFVELTYRPASAALDPVSLKQRRIPDVTQLSRPLTKLIELAQECCGALDPFSRFLGKNAGGHESLAAFALLPEDLVEATPSSDAASLASLVSSRLDANGRAHLAAGELLYYVRLSKPDKASKNEAILLAQALEKLGYGIEPDVRLGGPVYDIDGRVVVFRRLPDCPSAASDEYAAATLLMRLGALVSAADEGVSISERELLERHIQERLQLTAGERQRLAAHLAWLLEADLGMTGLKRRLESLDSPARGTIGKLLIEVAATDGNVDAREMKILEKLYDLLDLPAGDLYRDVHAAQAQDDEPVVVDQPGAPKGFAIPSKPAPPAPSGIDMDRVRLKIVETRQVSTLLASIFVDEETPVAAAPVIAQANTIGTLDVAHSELLRRLAARELWPRDDVERLTAELALLTDGALETINDYAYATLDEPLWEDDDPIAINSKAAMELIA